MHLVKQQGEGISGLCQIIKTRCSDLQRQSSAEKIGAKKHLLTYRDVREEKCMYMGGGIYVTEIG
jgi:hypothetical protein